MGLFQQRLAERRRQQHGAAALDIADLGTPDLSTVELTVRTSTKREQLSNLRKTRVDQRTVTPVAKPVKAPPTCTACGVEVPGKRRKVRYCVSCLEVREKQLQTEYEAKRREQRTANQKMQPCAHCQTPMPVRGRAKYCGDPCRDEARRLHDREQWEFRVSGTIEGGYIERERRFNAARKAAKESA